MFRAPVRLLLIGAIALAVASCQSSEEKAAKLVAEGVVLEQDGKIDAAQAAFREALRLDADSIDARRALAALNLRIGNAEGARAQYMAIRERLPEDVEANLALAELALAAMDTELASSYLSAPAADDPGNPRTEAAEIGVAFYSADAAGDDTGRAAALDRAKALLRKAPANLVVGRIVIQSLMNGPDPEAALPVIEEALERHPGNLELEMMKLNVLTRRADGTAGADQLKAMYRQFPGNAEVQTWLRDWYLAHGATEETVTFLRDLAARRNDGPEAHDGIADYIESRLPPPAAVAELDRIAADYPAGAVADTYRVHAAAIRFRIGDASAAAKEMRDILGKGRPLTASPRHRTMLADVLHRSGQRADAEQIIGTVVERAPSFLPAQKLRATWLIEGGDSAGAIAALRIALTSAPRDPELLTLLGRAYEADGSVDLAGGSFAEAVEAAAGGVRETALLVRFLLRQDDPAAAEPVLRKALDAHPDDAGLLALAQEAGLTPPAGN